VRRSCPLSGAQRVAPLLALLAAGCASSWNPATTAPPAALQWPAAPAPARITYARALTGFASGPDLGATLRALAIGREGRRGGSFLLPVAIAVGNDGRIAVADLGSRCVHLYLPATRRYLRLTGAKGHPLLSPVAVAFGADLRLFVSDSAGKVVAFSPDGDILFTLRQAGSERLERPTGLAWSPTRARLYVVDTAVHRIHVFAADGSYDFSFGRRGGGGGETGPEAELNFPTHLARSPAGQLLVTDALNFRVVTFDEDGHPIGAFGRHGDGSGDLAMPKGVAVDRDGVVYLADALFDNVQLFRPTGELLLTLGARGTGFGEFWLPAGIFLSAAGELYVCDPYNRRVQVFRLAESHVEPTP